MNVMTRAKSRCGAAVVLAAVGALALAAGCAPKQAATTAPQTAGKPDPKEVERSRMAAQASAESDRQHRAAATPK
jgi:hypothetical protein